MALKYKVIRCVAYTIEIILLFILQELPYLMPSLLGVRPLLLIAAPMTIAILENEKIGLGFGVFAGLLMDMGYGSVIGFHAIVLGVLGFFIGLLAVNLVKTNVLTSLLCTAARVRRHFPPFRVFLFAAGLRHGLLRLSEILPANDAVQLFAHAYPILFQQSLCSGRPGTGNDLILSVRKKRNGKSSAAQYDRMTIR